jgi:hypothetical protein
MGYSCNKLNRSVGSLREETPSTSTSNQRDARMFKRLVHLTGRSLTVRAIRDGQRTNIKIRCGMGICELGHTQIGFLWNAGGRHPVPIEPIPAGIATAGVGHEDQFAPPGPSGRCWFGQATFTGTHGNERDAPREAVPGRLPFRGPSSRDDTAMRAARLALDRCAPTSHSRHR